MPLPRPDEEREQLAQEPEGPGSSQPPEPLLQPEEPEDGAPEPWTFLQLPPEGEAARHLPGSPEDSFHIRCSRLRAARSVPANLLVLVIGLAVYWRCRRLLTPATAVWICGWIALALAGVVWRLAAPESYVRWREVPAALLQLTIFLTGAGWQNAFALLDDLAMLPALQAGTAPPVCGSAVSGDSGGEGAAEPACSAAQGRHLLTDSSGGTSVGELWGLAGHVSLLLHASVALFMAAVVLSLRLRLCLGAVVQAAVAARAVGFTPLICAGGPLTHAAAQQRTHLIYQALSVLGYLLPLPVSRFVRPDPGAECATVLTWLQLSVGLLMPLMWHAVSEARLFQLHQRQRWEAGLEPERGWLAAVYDTVWWLTLGGSGPPIALVCWLLLAACWDWTAFFCTPPDLRTF